MKTKASAISLGIVSILIGGALAQNRHSGIYQGTVNGQTMLAAVTGGGRVLGLDNTAEGLGDTTDPHRSTVSRSGRLRAVTPNGTVITGKVSSTGKLSGTVKIGGNTARLTGRKILP